MISGIGVFYPDKTPTQRIGIVPNVEVKPTLAGIRAGRDEVLEEALRRSWARHVAQSEIEKWPGTSKFSSTSKVSSFGLKSLTRRTEIVQIAAESRQPGVAMSKSPAAEVLLPAIVAHS